MVPGVGAFVGPAVGATVGPMVVSFEGAGVGPLVGALVGALLGAEVGALVGAVGGPDVGADVGAFEGAAGQDARSRGFGHRQAMCLYWWKHQDAVQRTSGPRLAHKSQQINHRSSGRRLARLWAHWMARW